MEYMQTSQLPMVVLYDSADCYIANVVELITNVSDAASPLISGIDLGVH
jgi:hypothetical protein